MALAAVVSVAIASWYGPGLFGNPLACGGHLTVYTDGVANRSLPCGTRLRICYRARCAVTRVVDRGPFIAGRSFDLTAHLARRLHFSGVDRVRWQLAHVSRRHREGKGRRRQTWRRRPCWP